MKSDPLAVAIYSPAQPRANTATLMQVLRTNLSCSSCAVSVSVFMLLRESTKVRMATRNAGMTSDKPLPKAGSVAFQRKRDARREANAIVGRLGGAEVVADRSDGPY